MGTTERLKWIDVAKGVGILLVFLGHSKLPVVHSYIYMFHMPLFYVLCGLCWDTGKYISLSFDSYLKKKFISYIVPYLKISLVCLLVYGVLYNGITIGINEVFWKKLAKYILGLYIYSRGTTEWMPRCSPIWFLTCIFYAEIMLFFLRKQNSHKQIFCVILSAIIGYIFSLTVKLPMNIDNAFTALPFMYLGVLLRENKTLLQSDKLFIISFLLSIPILLFGLKLNDFDGNRFNSLPFTYIQASVLVFCVLSACRKWGGGGFLYIQWLGRYTLPLMGYNYLIILIVSYMVHSYWLSPLMEIFIGVCMCVILSKFPIIKKIMY